MAKQKESKQKHVPMRTCIATGEKLPKREMMRLVRTHEKKSGQTGVAVDPQNKIRGRGANLKMGLDTFDLAVKKGAIVRALKLERKLSDNEIRALREEFSTAIEEKEFRKGNRRVAFKISKKELQERLAE